MSLRKKSQPAPGSNVEDSDTASVFEETHDTPVLDPARPRKVLGVKRKSVENMEGELAKRKTLLRPDESCLRVDEVANTAVLRVEELPKLIEESAPVEEVPVAVVRPATPLIAAPVPKQAHVSRIFPTEVTPKDYVFIVKPLMGTPFEIKMTSDSSIFDLKDTIFAKIGIVPEMQLLSHSNADIRFDEEEKFLDELPIPQHCSLNLTVKAATGISVLNTLNFEDIDEEEYFIYDVIPATGIDSSDSEGDPLNDEENGKKLRLRIALPPSIATASIPIPVLDSYIVGRALGKENEKTENDIEEPSCSLGDLSALRICSDHEVLEEPSSAIAVQENKEPGRCVKCGRRCRVALQFRCRCGGVYCQSHRYGDQHECTFDYQSHDRARLEINNPKVSKSKLDHF